LPLLVLSNRLESSHVESARGSVQVGLGGLSQESFLRDATRMDKDARDRWKREEEGEGEGRDIYKNGERERERKKE
jgi:hypothetical protein